MQLTEVFFYALLSIIISSVCVQAERNHELEERKFDKRLRRRETTVLVDSFPTEKIYQKPKVIYRRLSKYRYRPPKPKYGITKLKYGPPKSTRRPGKKFKGKYWHLHNKGVTNKPRYGTASPNRIVQPKPYYGPSKKRNPYHAVYKNTEPASFGEPPNYEDEYRPTPEYDDFQKPTLASYPDSNQGYGEPPVDSYGAPIKPSLHDLTFHTTSHNLPGAIYNDEFGSDFEIWRNHEKEQDHHIAYSKIKPAFDKPIADADVYVTPIPKDEIEELNLNSYSDIYNYRQNKEKIKKKKPHYVNNVKMMNRPWRGKYSSNIDDEVVVGGQYAEPPARYVPKLKPSAPMSNDDDHDFGSPENHDPEKVSSATNSPYVNYKHSNVAFSPQNLNDAFSIVD